MSEADEILKDFLVESREGLDRVERELVVLEKEPRNAECLGSIFRALHTLKGNSTFFQFETIRHLAHAGESLLGRLRAGELAFTPTMADALLAMADALRALLRTVEESGSEGAQRYEDLVETLTRLAHPAADSAAPTPPAPAPPSLDATTDFPQASGSTLAPEPVAEPQPPDGATLVVKARRPAEAAPAPPPPPQPPAPAPAPEPVAATLPRVQPTEGTGDGLSASNIRVDVEVLDRLMNMVGELVLTRNRLVQLTNSRPDPALADVAQRLNQVTAELQEGILKTRMQRIGVVWQRFPRLVRDLARECGKEVVLEMHGSETELDRTLLEAIADPLVHILRNAIDHGIEQPDVRRARGKPPEGRLVLRAFHESGQVLLEISDDGGGIDPERVRRKLIERGIMDRQHAASLTAPVLISSIFLPGFSTADKVSHISGRGVGMDVVRTNIERYGGTVDIESQIGAGTTFRIRLPLTLAIIPALLVTSNGHRYAVPQVNVLELLSLDPATAAAQIEHVRGMAVYRLRGKLLPLVHLDQLLGRDVAPTPPGPTGDYVNIAVLRVNDEAFGLVVDEIRDSEEIVVKPFGSTLKGLPLYAGATILGDGQVALILDVLGLARRAGILSKEGGAALKQPTPPPPARTTSEKVLVCEIAGARRVAVPLQQVTCLEEFPAAAVEGLVGQEVVQYRGGLLPLVRLRRVLLHDERPDPSDPLQVVVAHDEQQHGVGVVVDRILDVADEPETVEHSGRGPAVRGAAIIDGAATDLLDLWAAVRFASRRREG